MAATGRVELIVISPETGGETDSPGSVQALAGRGILGDRYCLPESGADAGRNLTLIERASFDHLEALGLGVQEAELRRNIVVSGIDLNPLVGSEFTVGGVRCRATELCEPCRGIERRTKEGVLRALVGRGGIRAEILCDRTISVGDAVSPG